MNEPMFFDIEANGFLENVTKIHCLVIKHKGEVYRFSRGEIPAGINKLVYHRADGGELVAHNGIKYDAAVIRKLYNIHLEDALLDTLVLSRLVYPDIRMQADDMLIAKGRLPSALGGKHSLEAWGYRLGEHKGEYDGGWEEWSKEMEDYCVQDVEVLEKLYHKLMSKVPQNNYCVMLEHQVQRIIFRQEQNGFGFDKGKAYKLYGSLKARQAEVFSELERVFQPWFGRNGGPKQSDMVVKKRRRVKRVSPTGKNYIEYYEEGCRYTKVHLIEFNPGSRDHITARLQKVWGWRPKKFTETGKPAFDEESIVDLKVPFKPLLLEYLMLEKRLGQVGEGKQAWIKLEQNGRIHGSVITNGAVTGRATHNSPNVGQVPANDKPFGKECRELFRPCIPGWVQVGCDLEGLELRCLSHRMFKWDAGEYVREILSGDPHTKNQLAAGLPTRPLAKTFIYGFLYGAGDEKIGKIVGKGRRAGAELKKTFLAKTPALAKLIDAVKSVVRNRGYLIGLDGRHVPIRKEHAALNSLLQGDGALISKRWMVEADALIVIRGIRCNQMAWVHDELQFECHPEDAQLLGETLVEAARLAGEFFKLNIRIDAKFVIGSNWKECH